MAFLLEKLAVYNKAVDFAEQVIKETRSFPKGYSGLVDQLQRAAISVVANIAEGNGRWHPKDRANFFLIARGSAFETLALLQVSQRVDLITEPRFNHYMPLADEIAKMLTGLTKVGKEKSSFEQWIEIKNN
jgi:four helix bundle protein